MQSPLTARYCNLLHLTLFTQKCAYKHSAKLSAKKRRQQQLSVNCWIFRNAATITTAVANINATVGARWGGPKVKDYN